MRRSTVLIATLVSMLVSTLCAAQTVSEMGSVYSDRCANCLGVTANGVPKIEAQPGVKAE